MTNLIQNSNSTATVIWLYLYYNTHIHTHKHNTRIQISQHLHRERASTFNHSAPQCHSTTLLQGHGDGDAAPSLEVMSE